MAKHLPPSQVRDAAHERFFTIICLEAAVCFLVPSLFLTVGVLYAPLFALALVLRPYDPDPWQFLGKIMLGSGGIASIARVLYLLETGMPADPRRWMTLLGLTGGVAVALVHALAVWNHRAPGGIGFLLLIFYLPVACTLHLLYLARRPLLWPRHSA
jgi:hypothetical protein